MYIHPASFSLCIHLFPLLHIYSHISLQVVHVSRRNSVVKHTCTIKSGLEVSIEELDKNSTCWSMLQRLKYSWRPKSGLTTWIFHKRYLMVYMHVVRFQVIELVQPRYLHPGCTVYNLGEEGQGSTYIAYGYNKWNHISEMYSEWKMDCTEMWLEKPWSVLTKGGHGDAPSKVWFPVSVPCSCHPFTSISLYLK